MSKACLLLLVTSERVPAAGLGPGQDAVACGREPTVRAQGLQHRGSWWDPPPPPPPPISVWGWREHSREKGAHIEAPTEDTARRGSFTPFLCLISSREGPLSVLSESSGSPKLESR